MLLVTAAGYGQMISSNDIVAAEEIILPESYDITVEKNANYVLDCGLVAHNSGKTFLALRVICKRAIDQPSNHLVTRFRFSHAKQAICYQTMPDVIESIGMRGHVHLNKSDWFYEFPNGSTIWVGGLDDKDRTEKILGNEYCVHPDTKVLLADLSWRRAVDVKKDDEIIAFPESLEGHFKLIRSKVEFNKQLHKRRYRVSTNKGETIVSEGHKFVAYFDDRRVRNFRAFSWKSIEELSVGDKLRFAAEPWPEDRSYDGGWMAGMYDGEGWISAGTAGVAQRKGDVLNRIIEILRDRGIEIREHYDGNCSNVMATGLWNSMRSIGMFRPSRLIKKAHKLWENRRGFNGRGGAEGSPSRHKVNTEAKHVAEIINIEQIEDGEVRAIQTSSKTLITDGFLSHNCTIFLNEASQISYDAYETVSTRLNPPKGMKGRILVDYNPPSIRHWGYQIFHKREFPDGRPVPDDDYATIRMNPADNPYLSDEYTDNLQNLSAAKRKRFLEGEYSLDSGSLWKRAWINYSSAVPEDLTRVVVGVDPAGTVNGDEVGIIVVGERQKVYYVLDDYSLHGSPAQWAEEVAAAFRKWSADVVVAEKNYGGDMVEHTIKSAQPAVNVKLINSSRGKVVRAEPISAIYETGEVYHRTPFPELEDEMCIYDPATQSDSPNRMDALVFAMSELSGEGLSMLDVW